MLGAKRPALLQGALLQVGRILKLNKYIYIYIFEFYRFLRTCTFDPFITSFDIFKQNSAEALIFENFTLFANFPELIQNILISRDHSPYRCAGCKQGISPADMVYKLGVI